MNNPKVEPDVFLLSKESGYISLTFSIKILVNLEKVKRFESFIHENVKEGDRLMINFSNAFNINKEARDYLKVNFKFPENCKVAILTQTSVSQFIVAISFLFSQKVQHFKSFSTASDWLLKE